VWYNSLMLDNARNTGPAQDEAEAGRLALQGLILLDPADNCYVVTRDLHPGDAVDLADENWVVDVALSPGHKVARTNIEAGTVVRKLGVPIGVASRPIMKFEHIHLHNVHSQYVPTYERGGSLVSTSE
jgi:(2R)-sulfolactate sulfo-lyase subunit alpha